jgi:hypothetical protein
MTVLIATATYAVILSQPQRRRISLPRCRPASVLPDSGRLPQAMGFPAPLGMTDLGKTFV